MKRAYKHWIKSCLLIAITFFIIALTNLSNWAAVPIIAGREKTSSSPTTKNLTVATAASDVLGYSAVFDEELKQIGQISPQDFAQRYASKAQYLPQISWNATTAKFWDKFNLSPEDVKISVDLSEAPYNFRRDFKLSPEELEVFKQNGFVVSERMSAPSFASLFYNIYSRDLPVFVSSDALLHAWHRSYNAMLEELEESYLARTLEEILQGMASKIPQAQNQYGNGILNSSVSDADYFLSVALSLLRGNAVKTYLNQDARVSKTLKAIQDEQLQEFQLFGRDREMDFSQFKPRGHYEKSEALKKYFQAMMWCGKVDLRIAGTPQDASPRELGAAITLHNLLQESGKFKQWQQFDQLLQTFVGKTDSMTFAQLGNLLEQAKIKSPADIKNLETLAQLQADILASKIGFQNIRSDYYESPPFEQEKIQLPRSFTLLGQKFVLDSWVMSKVVFDEILWNEKKVQRRVPTSLDVAFAALGNNQVVPDLAARMTNTNGRQFRDGLNYQHNLAAVRQVVDKQNQAVWEENLYMSWLSTLRELSAPTTEPKYPEAMRTRAWAMKTLNTQLASWTQLRHDTILYAKEAETGGISCYYPAGFVEPRPEFWERFEKMARLAANLIEKTPFPGSFQNLQQKQSLFLKNFAQQLATLKAIAVKELAQEQLTEAQTKFLRDVVEIKFGSGGPRYNGWYPNLFYKEPKDSDKWDAIVADVHTDVPAPEVGDQGSVLHEGVADVDLLMIAVDNGSDKMVYAGPVLSHYEFEMPAIVRKSDSEWQQNVDSESLPPRPDWTKSYLISNKRK